MLDEEPNVVQSVLPNMLSTAMGTTIDARLDYTYIGDADVNLFALSLHGQYISLGGLGVYGSLPYGYGSEEDDGLGGEGESASGIGNLEAGALYASRSPNMDILLRGGIALDTTDDEDAFLVPATQVSPRLTDALTTGFATTWARLQGQLRHSSGNLRIGALGGFDIPVDGLLEEADAFDGLLNLAVSLGVETPGFGLGFGIAYVQIVGAEGDDDDNSQFGFNATIDFPVGPKARLFGALGIPDLDNFDDRAGDIFAIGGGVRASM